MYQTFNNREQCEEVFWFHPDYVINTWDKTKLIKVQIKNSHFDVKQFQVLASGTAYTNSWRFELGYYMEHKSNDDDQPKNSSGWIDRVATIKQREGDVTNNTLTIQIKPRLCRKEILNNVDVRNSKLWLLLNVVMNDNLNHTRSYHLDVPSARENPSKKQAKRKRNDDGHERKQDPKKI